MFLWQFGVEPRLHFDMRMCSTDIQEHHDHISVLRAHIEKPPVHEAMENSTGTASSVGVLANTAGLSLGPVVDLNVVSVTTSRNQYFGEARDPS